MTTAAETRISTKKHEPINSEDAREGKKSSGVARERAGQDVTQVLPTRIN